MANIKSFCKHLDPHRVWLAGRVAEEKIKIAQQAVLDRVKKDAEFASDVLKAVGNASPPEVKVACEESIKNKALVGGDLTHEMVPVQTDGGREILVNEVDLPNYPTDGPNSAIDFQSQEGYHPEDGEKIVMFEGPKAERA